MANADFQVVKKIVREFANASSLRSCLVKLLKEHGFLSIGKGNWLGLRNRDVISGIKLEGTGSAPYISSFVLPAFDRNSLVHWTLGDRLAKCSSIEDTGDQFAKAFDAYHADILPIRTADDLLGHVGRDSVDGDYATWTSFICLLRTGRVEEAAAMLDNGIAEHLHSQKLQLLNELADVVRRRDRETIDRKLAFWRLESETALKLPEDDFCISAGPGMQQSP